MGTNTKTSDAMDAAAEAYLRDVIGFSALSQKPGVVSERGTRYQFDLPMAGDMPLLDFNFGLLELLFFSRPRRIRAGWVGHPKIVAQVEKLENLGCSVNIEANWQGRDDAFGPGKPFLTIVVPTDALEGVVGLMPTAA